MLTPDEIKIIFDLGHRWELIAGGAFNRAQQQYSHGSPEFNQAYHDYVTTMQNVRNSYFMAVHDVVQSLVSGDDLKRIADETKNLQDSLDRLKVVENDIAITVQILTVAATVTTAVLAPNPASVAGAVGGLTGLIAAIANAAQRRTATAPNPG